LKKRRRTSKKPKFRPEKPVASVILAVLVLVLVWPHLRLGLLKVLFPTQRPLPGTLEEKVSGDAIFSGRDAILRAPSSGSMKYLVKNGDVVRVGDVIAEIGDKDVLSGAQETLAFAKESLTRYESETQETVDDLSAEIESLYQKALSLFGDMRKAYAAGNLEELLDKEKEFWTQSDSVEQTRSRLGLILDRRAELLKEVEMAQSILSSSSVKILSPIAGVFSSEVSQIDEKTTPEQLTGKDASELMVLLAELKASRASVPAESSRVNRGDLIGKVVSCQDVSFFMPVKTEARPDTRPGDAVILHLGGRLDDGVTLQAVIKSVTDGKPPGYSVISGEIGYLPRDKIMRTAQVSLVTKRHTGLIIPVKSLLEKDGQPGVLVVEKTYARFRPVEVLMSQGGQVAVKGLKDTDEILTRGLWFLEGRRVR